MTTKAIEQVAKLVHDAMYWAAQQAGPPQRWQNGNSLAEGKAREAAQAAITAHESVLVEENERLREALKLVVPIIEEEREITVDSHTILYRGNPGFGKVTDPDALEQIAIYDAALEAARAALEQGKQP